MILRPYQSDAVSALRSELKNHRAALLQLATGGGKTAVFSHITNAAHGLGRRVWIIAPRNTLVDQASDHLSRYRTAHGRITAKISESLAYIVHVVSLDTLRQRVKNGKIKNWPDLVIFDEAHTAFDAQIELAETLPASCKIIGVTATPERLDGRGLSELYGAMVEGPSIQYLVEAGFLSGLKYFCPPLQGLENLHRKGTEYDQDELSDLLEKRKVYGSAIAHYREYADKKPALVFCRSIKAAEETAERFSNAGYIFEPISGKMAYRKQKIMLDALRNGEVHGLTNCDLATYGVDVPRAEVGIMLRPTLSRALNSQMVGRILRSYKDPKTGYVKLYGIMLDHVNNLLEHGHPFENKPWNFHGDQKTKKKKGVQSASLKLCPKCFMYFEGAMCDNCGSERDNKGRKPMEEVDGRLVEITGPVKLNNRPPEERAEYIDRINSNVEEAERHQQETGEILPGPIGELLKMAEDLGYKVDWVYWRLSEKMNAVNVPLLHEIARQKGYKPSWVHFKSEQIRGRL